MYEQTECTILKCPQRNSGFSTWGHCNYCKIFPNKMNLTELNVTFLLTEMCKIPVTCK